MSDITRIMDLPENITMQSSTHNVQNQAQSFGGNSYTPMDVHPNPYGHPPPSVPTIPKPSDPGMQSIGYPGQGQGQVQGPGQTPTYNPQIPPSQPSVQQGLPSRDIPMDPSQFTHDEQVQPNYIPPVPESVRKTTDYVKQFEEATERKISKHDEEKAKQSRFDTLVEEGQIPILVAFLFFIFHMPIVNNLLFQYMPFLSLHTMDGNFNMYGLMFKSALFAGCFYMATQSIHLLSEL